MPRQPHPSWCDLTACERSRSGVTHRSTSARFVPTDDHPGYFVQLLQRAGGAPTLQLCGPGSERGARARAVELALDDVAVVAAMLTRSRALALAAERRGDDLQVHGEKPVLAPGGRATEPEWLTVADIAARTALHRVTVYRAIKAGKLHGHRLGTKGPVRVRPACLSAWAEGCTPSVAEDLCGCRDPVALAGR